MIKTLKKKFHILVKEGRRAYWWNGLTVTIWTNVTSYTQLYWLEWLRQRLVLDHRCTGEMDTQCKLLTGQTNGKTQSGFKAYWWGILNVRRKLMKWTGSINNSLVYSEADKHRRWVTCLLSRQTDNNDQSLIYWRGRQIALVIQWLTSKAGSTNYSLVY